MYAYIWNKIAFGISDIRPGLKAQGRIQGGEAGAPPPGALRGPRGAETIWLYYYLISLKTRLNYIKITLKVYFHFKNLAHRPS